MKRDLAAPMLCAALIIALCSIVGAQDMAELEVDHALTFDYPTPHTDWAQPYALGKTRVLFFTDGRGTNPRECVELMQRFDLEAEAVFYALIVDSTESHWHGGDIGESRMLKLLDQEWDCFVFLRIDMAQMSPEQQYKVLRPVVDGAGIVFAGGDDKRVLKPENRLADLPPILARGPVGEAYKVGTGRGMKLPGRPDLGYDEGWEVDYDHWSERLGRAILWAAGKEPKADLALKSAAPEFSWSEDKDFTAELAGETVGDGLRLEATLWGPSGVKAGELATPIAPGKPAKLSFGKLPAGKYYLDARVLSSAGVEAWASLQTNCTSPREIAEVKLYEEWGEIGDHIAGAVTLQGDPLDGEKLRVRLMDRRRRILATKEMAASNDPAEFDFEIKPWMPMLVTVDAQLLSQGQEAAGAHKYFTVTKRNRDQFNFLIWDTPNGTLAPYAEESLAKHSVTLQLRSGAPPAYAAANDIAWVPYTTRIMSKPDADGIMTPFCWNDAEAVQAHVTQKAKDYTPARSHGVFVYSLGDEVDTLGCCLSEYCADAYRTYLQEQYGSIAALNAEWGTDFAAWDEVGLSKPDDNEEANSMREKNYPRWFDRQAFKSYNFVQFCQKYAKAYQEIDPLAKTGFEGAGRFEKGDDLDLIIRSNQFWSPYPGTADEVIRSIAPREFPRANWMGYTKDADSLLQKYWRMVTRGNDAVWFWRWDCIGRFHGWLAPDFRPFPAVKEILQDTQFVRDGLGDLLLKSEMLDDGIAILYSYPSSLAHKLDEGASFGGYEPSHLAAHDLVRDLGMQFRYVTDRQLRLGEFDPTKYRVMLLPRVEAVGDEEAAVISDFAAAGGSVIADVRPGVYDGHCKPRETGALDDLFGITRTGRELARSADTEMYGKLNLDPSVAVRDAEAGANFDGIPAFISRGVGDAGGQAALFNFSAPGYPKLSLSETDEAAATTALNWFKSAGINPKYRITGADGSRERNVEVIRWQNGDSEIVALFRSSGVTSDAVMHLPGPTWVYDLRNRKSLGKVSSFETTIIANRASFFALLPDAAPSSTIKLTPAVAERGSVVKGSISVPGARQLHAVRIRARATERELEWLSRNIIVGTEPVEFDIPIAFNDPAGEYEISAIDLFTNKPTAARLSVR